jgi:heterodisulfide reductase subunit A2
MAEKANGKIGAVMVVGGGIGGMQASLDLANAGYKVYMVEETTAIGGRMAQLDKTFPTNDCSMCTISPKLIEVGKHMNIEILTNHRVDAVNGDPGNFSVTLTREPRYIDLDKCNACGDCIEVCPIHVDSEFDENTTDRKAVYKRYPQAIPGAMAISKAERPPCVLTCPTGTNVQGYVALVSEGRFAEAMDVIRDRNPFPSICGRVCHHPCEGECNRKDIDEAVAINPIKRFVSDWVFDQRAEGKEAAPPKKGELDPAKKDQKIAIIGGGPAGLTAAQDLALKGYPVTLFESDDKLGGTMLRGIPYYRLPEEKLQRDIDDIVASGFDVKIETKLGDDITFDSLQKDGYKAAYLALGCTAPAPLAFNTHGDELKGVELEGVHLGVDFLRDVSKGTGPALSGKVVVIGGGNVAIDVAMTAKRQGAGEVEIISLECREEMPAHEWEIQDAVDEGIKLNPAWGPYEILGENGKVSGMKLEQCTCVFDPDGKFAPEFAEGCWGETKADHVIIAIGQRSDFSFLKEDDPLWNESKRFIHADPVTLQSNVDWIFAGGDMATGPASVVGAIFQGHEGAESIERFLNGQDLTEGRAKDKPEPAPTPEGEFEKAERAVSKKVPVDQRSGYDEVEMTLDAETAVAEAKRCMACGICCECMSCVKACGPGAINHEDTESQYDLDVGSVIFTPGYDAFDPVLRGEYGYGVYENVVTSLEFERILSASGPYQGHVKRPGDLKEPKKMAWIQCVGSRDQTLGNDYCSSVCCMYAIKEALMAVDHVPGLESTVYYNDIRAYGKGFEFYYENSKEQYGVKYKRGIISSIKEMQQTKDLKIKWIDDTGEEHTEMYDMVVLSVGLCPSASAKELAAKVGLETNRFGFLQGQAMNPAITNREGIFVAGAFSAPMDIPETVMTASAAASSASEYLAEQRGTLVQAKAYPDEKDIQKEEPRIGVFVCRCGTNIARAVDVPSVVEYAKTLPNVVLAEENLYTCSSDTQQKITDTIVEHNLNRVVVASCTPRTHEPLFQDTLRDAGLNKYLFEMANIRDQCSWVHAENKEVATYKSDDLVRMAVARAATLEPLVERAFEVNQKALVIGGGLTGVVSALSLADQGFECTLVERDDELGGIGRKIHYALNSEPQAFLTDQIEKAKAHPKVTIYTGAQITDFGGHIGGYNATIKQGEKVHEIKFGAVIVAIGGQEYKPTEYEYENSDKIMTQLEFEQKITDEPDYAKGLNQVAMIQCVGSREENHLYCSRVCCQEAVKNALKVKEANPDSEVYVLYRDMRT